MEKDDNQHNNIWSYANYNIICEPSENLGGIYLGNFQASEDIEFFQYHDITVILDVAGLKKRYTKAPIEFFKSIPAQDSPTFSLIRYFDECVEYIHDHRTKRRNIFVHCLAGVSRSATIVIAYLMKNDNMNLKTAFQFVQKRRQCIAPNPGFWKQLEMYEKNLFWSCKEKVPEEKEKNKPEKKKEKQKKHQ